MLLNINSEVNDIEEKIVFNLNLRQTFCCSIGVVVGVALISFFTLVCHLDLNLASYLILPAMLIFVLFGFFDKTSFSNHLTFEKYLTCVINHMRQSNIDLAYRPRNQYEDIQQFVIDDRRKQHKQQLRNQKKSRKKKEMN